MFMRTGPWRGFGCRGDAYRVFPRAPRMLALLAGIAMALSMMVTSAALAVDGKTQAVTPVSSPEDASPIVARGTGLEIRESELQLRLRRSIAEITHTGRTVSAADEKILSRRLLDQLIFTRLAAARATPADRTRAQFESRAFIDGLQRRLGSSNALAQQLRAVGLTETAFRAEKLEEALALAVSEREVRGSIYIPDSEIQKYYDANRERWKQPEQVRVAHLLLANVNEKGEPLSTAQIAERKAQLLKFRQQVLAGTNFATLIRAHSDDTATRASGGEYTLSRAQMDPVFETAAFALQPGELSELVSTPYGVHLIQGRERIPVTNLPLAMVTADIRGLLIQREMEVRMPDYADRLRREAKVSQ